jgi:hypothetical protein
MSVSLEALPETALARAVLAALAERMRPLADESRR